MQIRNALPKDIGQISELCKAHAAYEKADAPQQNHPERLAKQLFHSETPVRCVVAEQDDEIIGFASFMKQFSTWDADYYVYLDCLYLKEKARGNGIGQQLLEKVKAYAKAEHCTLIKWQTPDFNVRAIRFYKRIGAFSKTKERFYWDV